MATEALALKKIEILDVVLENAGEPQNAAEAFDADVAITTGELGRMLPDLVAALGGLQEPKG